jgi:hypothetical protein
MGVAISTPMIINAALTVIVPTTVALAIALDVMAVVAWISGRLERRPEELRS